MLSILTINFLVTLLRELKHLFPQTLVMGP